MQDPSLRAGDALIIVDLQHDFLPGGALAVADGDAVIPVLNRAIAAFRGAALPIVATRDWHPLNHCSFHERKGPWPPHCIADSVGAAFPAALQLGDVTVVSKATGADSDAYSGFDGTDLGPGLRAQGVKRVFVGGLATDYCVLQTVLDGLQQGFTVVLLCDAIRAVDVHPGDGERAIARMLAAGAISSNVDALFTKPGAASIAA